MPWFQNRWTAVILALVVIGVVIVGAWMWINVRPPSGGPFTVVISEGADVRQAGEILWRAGVIADADAFARIASRTGGVVKPGRYVFTTGVTPWTAAKFLARGAPPNPGIEVTIPEGKRLTEMARLLESKGVCPADDFLRAAHDPMLIRDLLGGDVPGFEGYLFPDTYKFKPNADAVSVIRRMHARFREVLGALAAPGELTVSGLTTHQLVTLASIVEREARLPEERPIIAAVFLHRLRIGMRLEADPTIRYALNRWDTSPVLYSDLEVVSPYNTYRVAGLPPAPIAAPGRGSLEAVLHPADTNVLYFVARGDGSHAFAATFADHRANVAAAR